MKTVKVNYVGFWKGFNPENHYFHQTLKKLYDVQITDDADYIICSCFDNYSYIDYPQVRIMCSGENYVPDFNLVDYGISVYPVKFMDRHFSFPGMVGWPDPFYRLIGKERTYPSEILKEKTMFANSIFSHDSENGARTELVRLLSQYKRVESPGPLLYNMPNGEKVFRGDGSKEQFQRKTKFTLCCESICQDGFITEKIYEAFLADTVPVYYGSKTITDVFNPKAFINVSDFDSLQDVADYIIALDQNDEAYLAMLRQPIFHDANYIEKKLAELEAFLRHIFDQPLETAYRRSQKHSAAEYENTLKWWRQLMQESYGGLGIKTKLLQLLNKLGR